MPDIENLSGADATDFEAVINDIVGYSSGTSFPGSPSSGDRFYRTDLNMMAFYDGTRWLSDGPPDTMLIAPTRGAASPITSSVTYADVIQPWYGVYDIYLVRMVAGGLINGAAGNWSTLLRAPAGSPDYATVTVSDGGGGSSKVGSTTTFSDNVWAKTDPRRNIVLSENSGTSNYYPGLTALHYRLILT